MKRYFMILSVLLVAQISLLGQGSIKPKTVIFKFKISMNNTDPNLGSNLQQLLIAELDDDFAVLERDEINKVLSENARVQRMPNYFDEEATRKVGKRLFKANYSIIGQVSDAKNGAYAFVKLINNETAQIYSVSEPIDINFLKRDVKKLANSLVREYKLMTRNDNARAIFKNKSYATIKIGNNRINPDEKLLTIDLPTDQKTTIQLIDENTNKVIRTEEVKVDKYEVNYFTLKATNNTLEIKKIKHQVGFSFDAFSSMDILNRWLGEVSYITRIGNGWHVGASAAAISTTYTSDYETLPNLGKENFNQVTQGYYGSAVLHYRRYLRTINKTIYGELYAGGYPTASQFHPRFQLKTGGFINPWLSADVGFQYYQFSTQNTIFNIYGDADISFEPRFEPRVSINIRANLNF